MAFTRDTGHRFAFTVATPGELQKKLAAGATPDLVVLPAPVIERLEKSGTLQAGSRVDLARVGVGIVVRAGAPIAGYLVRGCGAHGSCSTRSRSFTPIRTAAASPARRWRG